MFYRTTILYSASLKAFSKKSLLEESFSAALETRSKMVYGPELFIRENGKIVLLKHVFDCIFYVDIY
jgi:hypothetical protein